MGGRMKDITPKHLRCSFGPSCPAVHRLQDGRLLIIGKLADQELFSELNRAGKLGQGEWPIVISAEYFPGLTLEDEQP
jgi:hypothetical protein